MYISYLIIISEKLLKYEKNVANIKLFLIYQCHLNMKTSLHKNETYDFYN